LGHLTRKTVPEMTYNVFSGTLNPTHFTTCVRITGSDVKFDFSNIYTR